MLPTTGGFGLGPSASGLQGQIPVSSSREQRWAGNQIRSISKERTMALVGLSIVTYLTIARSPSASSAIAASRSSMPAIGLLPNSVMTAPRGIADLDNR